MRQIQPVRCDSSPHRWNTACPPGLHRAGEGPACEPLAPLISDIRTIADAEGREVASAAPRGAKTLKPGSCVGNLGVVQVEVESFDPAADTERMTAQIDDRLLERWQASQRHQEEARRFLGRLRFPDPRGERAALEEIVGTIAGLEQTLQERASRTARKPAPER